MKINSIFNSIKKANKLNKTINKYTKYLPDSQQKQVNTIKKRFIKKAGKNLIKSNIKNLFK